MKIIILLGTITVAIASSVVKLSTITDHMESCLVGTKLAFVVKADGKSFFVDSYSKRSWNEASALCKSTGMSLASVTSQAQFVSLNGALVTELSDDLGYWTAGKDKQEISQFGWSGSNMDLSAVYLPFRTNSNIDHQTCVLFFKLSNNMSYLSYDLCSSKHYTLCEN